MKKETFFMMVFAIVFSARMSYSMGDDFALIWTSTVLPNFRIDLFGYCASVTCICLVLFFFLGASVVRIHQLSKGAEEVKAEDHLITK